MERLRELSEAPARQESHMGRREPEAAVPAKRFYLETHLTEHRL
jgi:hypothetical protein